MIVTQDVLTMITLVASFGCATGVSALALGLYSYFKYLYKK